MNKTDIEWTTFSANPLKYRDAAGKVVWACVKTSPGCAHCYSEATAGRWQRGGPFTATVMKGLTPFLDDKELRQMLTAKTVSGIQVTGSRVFVGDMTDLFGEWVSDEILDRLFAAFALRPDVTFQVLTKRAERMASYLGNPLLHNRLELAADELSPGKGHPSFGGKHVLPSLPLPNVHCGVSVEDQARADERIPNLLRTPAAVRFLSVEPMLGPVSLSFEIGTRAHLPGCLLDEINWVIVGGESGSGARPCNVSWIRSIIKQCKAAGVSIFVKQIGSRPVFEEADVWGRDSKGGDMALWPSDLRVREFPVAHRDRADRGDRVHGWYGGPGVHDGQSGDGCCATPTSEET